ncbi:MAG: XdhC family protein [Acidimicrobiales bacterium]|nr:XdhC family protein [Acidimicrobiales bacterium]
MPDTLFDQLAAAITAGRPAVLATAIDGDQAGAKVLVVAPEEGDGLQVTATGWTDDQLERAVRRDASAAVTSGATSVRRYGDGGRLEGDAHRVFHEAFVPPPRLIIFGAVDFSAALARVAKVLGFRVTVCDARPAFATRARFPEADEVIVDWPDRHLAEVGGDLGPRDAVCVLTHDAKFDVPAVVAALTTDVGYLGAMGSRRTTEDRARRLREAGVTDEGLARLLAPIGLDLGARTPEETAVAICAEIIACQTGRVVPRLRDTDGPIHGLRS